MSGGGQGGVDKDAQFTPFLFPTPRSSTRCRWSSRASLTSPCSSVTTFAEFWHLIQEGPRARHQGDACLRWKTQSGERRGCRWRGGVAHPPPAPHQPPATPGGGTNRGERDLVTGDKSPVPLSLKPKLNGFQGQTVALDTSELHGSCGASGVALFTLSSL